MLTRHDWTETTVLRALDHHVRTGAVRRYLPAPDSPPNRRRYIVDLPGVDTALLDLTEIHGLVLGLRAAEKRWRDDAQKVGAKR